VVLLGNMGAAWRMGKGVPASIVVFWDDASLGLFPSILNVGYSPPFTWVCPQIIILWGLAEIHCCLIRYINTSMASASLWDRVPRWEQV
jgi:hypothetical protein